MKKNYTLPLLFFLSFLFTAFNQLSAQPLSIEHKSYFYNKKRNLHSYSQAEVKLKDFTISADRLEYRPDDQLLIFDGDIFIRAPRVLIIAERASVNLKDSTASLYQAILFDQINNAVVKAEKITQTSPEKFIIEKGSLTLCRSNSPAWEIRSEQIVYRLDNFAYSTNTFLFFYRAPILYSPFFSWPTANKRSAGLLTPRYLYVDNSNKSKAYGHRLKIPYFLPFAQDHDLTITADIIEKRGAGAELDYQYAFVPGMLGQLRLWFLNESRRARIPKEENAEGDLDFNPYPRRRSFSFDHRQDIPFNGRFFFHHRQNSDNEVNREYLESGANYDYAFLTEAALVFPWENGAFFINYENGARFVSQSVFNKKNNIENYPAQVPSLSFFHNFNRIDNFPLSLGLSGGLSNYQKFQNWAGLLADGSLEVSHPFTLGFLNILPQYKRELYHYNMYYSGSRDYPNSFSLDIERKKIELNFEFFRLFYAGDEQADRKLSFRPSLVFEEIENANQSLAYNSDNSSAPNFIPPVFSRRTLTLKWGSLYQMKNRGSVKLDISQSYDFNSGGDVFSRPQEPETEPGYPLAPLRVEFSFFYNENISGGLFWRYDSRKKRIVESRADFSVLSDNEDKLTLSYIDNRQTYREWDDEYHPKAQFFTLSQNLRLIEKFEMNFEGKWSKNRRDMDVEKYDKQSRQFEYLGLSLIYKHNCYNIKASYSEKILQRLDKKPIKEDLEKKITLKLEIPFISNRKRIISNSSGGGLKPHYEYKRLLN